MSKVLIGIQFNGKNVESVCIYDLAKDKVEMLTTKKAKELYSDHELAVANADFNFFINSVNTHIGDQSQYPKIFDTPKGKNIENGVIIYDINKTEDNCYKTLKVSTAEVKQLELTDKQLIELYNTRNYKCNYSVDNNKLKIDYKEDGVPKELIDDDGCAELFNRFNNWYKIVDGRMEKISDCPVSTFEISNGEQIIDGFANSDKIKEVDLSGALYIAPKAFFNCSNLKKVTLSESLEKIGSQAFARCPNLTELSIPAKCSYVGTKIFDNGTVYLQTDITKIKGVITPFGAKTKIILNKKKTANIDEVKVAYKEDDKYLYYYKIDLTGLEAEPYKKAKIKKSNIDFMDTYINYKDDRVLRGNNSDKDIIICGKVGQEYLIINHNDDITQIDIDTIQELNYIPTDGTVTKTEIIPFDPEWGWFVVKKDEGLTTSKIGSQMTELADTGDILTTDQKMILADFINQKFESKYGKVILGSAKANKKSQEEKDKYPGYTWVYGGSYPGGVQCDNPGKIDPATGKRIYKDNSGNYFCYFGHPTYNHIMAKGYKDGKLVKIFTFGEKCASDFLNIDFGSLAKIKEFQGILTEAINEVTKVVKEKSYQQYLKNHLKFYEIMAVLNKADRFDLLGPYGRTIKKCLDAKIIVPSVVEEEVLNYVKENYTQYEIYKLCIKSKKNLDIVYNYPTLLDTKTDDYMEDIRKNLDDYLAYYIKYPNSPRDSFNSLKDIEKRVSEIQVDEDKYNEIEHLRQEFDKMEFERGKYVLEESFLIDTDNCKIIDFSQSQRESDSKYKELCSFREQATENIIDFFKNKVDKSTKRPTYKYPLYESKYIKEANMLYDLLDISNIPENKVRIIVSNYYSYSKILDKKNMVALAYKDTLWGFGTGNANKPIILYKNGKLNYTDEYGLIPSMKNSHKYYTSFFSVDWGSDKRAYIELDYDTSNFKFSTMNKLPKYEFEDKDYQAYQDLIKGFNLSKYARKGYSPDLATKLIEIFKECSENDNSSDITNIDNFILITRHSSVKGNLYLNTYPYLIHKEDKSIYIYPEYSVEEKKYHWIPYSLKEDNLQICGEVKNGKTVRDVSLLKNESFYYENVLFSYDGNLKQEDLTRLDKIYESWLSKGHYDILVRDNDNNIYYYDRDLGICKNCNEWILKIEDSDLNIDHFHWLKDIDWSEGQEYDSDLYDKTSKENTLKNIERWEKEQKEAEAQQKELENKKEQEYLNIEKHFEELKKNEDKWKELGISDKYLNQFDKYRKRSFSYILEDVENNYKKLQKHLNKALNLTSQTIDTFTQALKDNINDVDKWISNKMYVDAYRQLGQKLIDGKDLVGKQYQIVKHMKADLSKYLNQKF